MFRNQEMALRAQVEELKLKLAEAKGQPIEEPIVDRSLELRSELDQVRGALRRSQQDNESLSAELAYAKAVGPKKDEAGKAKKQNNIATIVMFLFALMMILKLLR